MTVLHLVEVRSLVFLIFLLFDFIQKLCLLFSFKLLISFNANKLFALFSELPTKETRWVHVSQKDKTKDDKGYNKLDVTVVLMML